MNQLGVLIPILALIIPIIAIGVNGWRRVQERKLDLIAQGAMDIDRAVQAKLEKLEARIVVLERIVTDKRISLADEIDRLGN
jgi:hypothetical protein